MKNWVCSECGAASQTESNIIMSICGRCQITKEEVPFYKFKSTVEVKEE